MDKKIILVLVLALAVIVIAAAAMSGGGSDDKKETPETPDTPVVEIHATSIALDTYTTTTVYTGSVTLKATLSPVGSIDEITWASSDESIATVKDGVVSAHKYGPCVISAESNGFKAECLLIVTNDVITHNDATAAKIEGKRVLRTCPLSESGIASALMTYGYSEEIAKTAASDCTGEWQFYADKAAKLLDARGSLDHDGIVTEMIKAGWSEEMAKEAITML